MSQVYTTQPTSVIALFFVTLACSLFSSHGYLYRRTSRTLIAGECCYPSMGAAIHRSVSAVFFHFPFCKKQGKTIDNTVEHTLKDAYFSLNQYQRAVVDL